MPQDICARRLFAFAFARAGDILRFEMMAVPLRVNSFGISLCSGETGDLVFIALFWQCYKFKLHQKNKAMIILPTDSY